MRSILRSVARDREILDAAAELFYERGFHAVGVDEIGAAVGVTGPAIYRHFNGKDEILATLFNEALDELLVRVESQDDDDPRRDLALLVRAQVEFAIAHRHLVSIYTREERSLVEPWRRLIRHRTRQHTARWTDALGRVYPDASPERLELAAHAAIGLVHSVAHWPKSARSSPDAADSIVALVLEGCDSLGHAAAVPGVG